MLFLFFCCLVVSSSFEDQLTSLNGSAPLDSGQANGPQETGRGYRLHRQSLFVVVDVVVFVLDNCLILCLNQRSPKLILKLLSLSLNQGCEAWRENNSIGGPGQGLLLFSLHQPATTPSCVRLILDQSNALVTHCAVLSLVVSSRYLDHPE